MEPTDEPRQAAEPADNPEIASATPVPPATPASEAEPAPIPNPESTTAPEGTAAAAPEPPAVAEVAAADTAPDPVIASTVTIPAKEQSDDGGGEWDLLVEKIKAWIDSNALGSLWTQAQLPLRLIGGVILFVLVSTIYGGILGTINKVPLAPGLLELFGVIWLVNYASSNLVRSSDRKRVIDALGSTWNKIVGR